MEWFYYDNNGALFNPLSYYSVTVPICPGDAVLCAIRAVGQNIGNPPVLRPIITSALQTEITAALSTGNESATVLLKF